jgi:hypothetical protein
LLVVHPDSIDFDTMMPEELDSRAQSDSCVLGAEANQGLEVDIPTITAYLEVACAGRADFRQGPRIVQMEDGGSRDILYSEGKSFNLA